MSPMMVSVTSQEAAASTLIKLLITVLPRASPFRTKCHFFQDDQATTLTYIPCPLIPKNFLASTGSRNPTEIHGGPYRSPHTAAEVMAGNRLLVAVVWPADLPSKNIHAILELLLLSLLPTLWRCILQLHLLPSPPSDLLHTPGASHPDPSHKLWENHEAHTSEVPRQQKLRPSRALRCCQQNCSTHYYHHHQQQQQWAPAV
jgi:hypothetical protein